MEHKETDGSPHVKLLGLPILILLVIAMTIVAFSAKAQSIGKANYNWNHARFKQHDTVQNFHTGLLYSIVAPQLRHGKKQLFYSGVSLSHNDTVSWIPENSIRRVRLWWDDKGAHVKEL